MKQELKALGQITWYLAKILIVLFLAQQYIWLLWAVWN